MRTVTTTEMHTLYCKRRNAFENIARALGAKHPITKMMGSLAWGRHDYEGGPDDKGLRFESVRLGYLIGRFDTLNLWARDNDADAQRVMLKLWPRGWNAT